MRIWVARPQPGAARTANRLAALGHDPLLASILVIAETGERPPQRRFDAALLTSANAVSALADIALDGMPILCVGSRTAKRARAAGLDSVSVAGGDADALASLVAERIRPGAALLLVAGADRKDEPAKSLRANGFDVAIWTAYAALPVTDLPEPVADALRGDSGDALSGVLHYSRRSAATALALARRAGYAERFAALDHYCLSADVAVPLVEAGIVSHFVAARPEEDSLFDLLSRGQRAAGTH